jgi:Tol biopolymer transport system component
VTTAAGQIPADPVYVLVQQSGAERVLLLDLAAKRSKEVLHFERPAAGSRSVVMSATGDGQTIAILERSDATRILHILKPATGAIRSLPQPEGVDGPSLSPDGSRVAVSWKTTDPVLNGLWLLPVDGSLGTRLIAEDPAAVGSPPQPRAWSIDGRWLAAYGNAGGGGNQILVVDTRAGSTTYAPSSGLSGGDSRVLAGIDAVWRGSEVLTWNSRTASSGAPAVVSYDVQTRASSTLFTAGSDQNILDVLGRPNTRQIAVLSRPFSNVTPSTPSTILLAEPGNASRTLASTAFVSLLRWSSDGASLFVRGGGDDSVGGITDVFGTWGTMPYCLRGGDAPPCL